MQSLERHEGHFYNWYDTQIAASRCRRSTSRRSTAATSPGICDAAARAARRLPTTGSSIRAGSKGLSDTVRAARRRRSAPHAPPALVAPAARSRLRLRRPAGDASRPRDSGSTGSTASIAERRDRGCRHRDDAADVRAASTSDAACWTDALVRAVPGGCSTSSHPARAVGCSCRRAEQALAELPRLSRIPTLRELAALEARIAAGDRARAARRRVARGAAHGSTN